MGDKNSKYINNSIPHIMGSEHRTIDQLVNSLTKNNIKNFELIYLLKQIIQRHFAWEEQVLFPYYEQVTEDHVFNLISILKEEHNLIQNVFLNNLEVQIKNDQSQNMEINLKGLAEILEMHKNMEQKIFYPWFENNLAEVEVNEIIKNMKNIYLS